MNLILNILWALLGGGLITALQYFIAGVFCSITIVALPFGLQCFKIAELSLFPFGREFVALSLAVTIIGLPFAFQHLKLALLAFAPFGLEIQDKP